MAENGIAIGDGVRLSQRFRLVEILLMLAVLQRAEQGLKPAGLLDITLKTTGDGWQQGLDSRLRHVRLQASLLPYLLYGSAIIRLCQHVKKVDPSHSRLRSDLTWVIRNNRLLNAR